MQIGASYSLQFSLVMGCGREPSPHIDTQVRLEFSTNHGLTWHLVKEVRKSLFKIINMHIFCQKHLHVILRVGIWFLQIKQKVKLSNKIVE